MPTALAHLQSQLMALGSASEYQATQALTAVMTAVAIILAISFVWLVFGRFILWVLRWTMAVIGIGLVAWGLTVVTGGVQ